jgi:hypothetical protein
VRSSNERGKDFNMRIQSLLFAGIIATCFAFAAVGCKDDEKNYSCEEAVGKMYDAGCELWCYYDGTYLYLDQCDWYDDGDPANFDQDVAEDLCSDFEDVTDDAECNSEFQTLMNCIVKERDNCADDCEDQAADFYDCIS